MRFPAHAIYASMRFNLTGIYAYVRFTPIGVYASIRFILTGIYASMRFTLTGIVILNGYLAAAKAMTLADGGQISIVTPVILLWMISSSGIVSSSGQI